MPPQRQEADIEEMPMSYSVGKSSFGLLDEAEGSSVKLIASVAVVSVILAGTFFIAVGIRRPASARVAETSPASATQVASNVSPAPPMPDLKTVDSVGLTAPTPIAKTDAVVPAAPAPQLQAQATAPVAAPLQAPTAKPPSKTVKTDKRIEATRAGPSLAKKRAVRSAGPAAVTQPPPGSSSLMTVMPDPTPTSQVFHHAAAVAPSAVPASSSAVKSAQIPAARARKQVASTSVGNRIKPVDMGKTTTGKISTVGIPATAGSGLVGARGAVSSTGIPAGTVQLTQAEASKKVAAAGIPAATALTLPTKRTVAPAPANLNMISRRSSGSIKQNN